MEKLTFTNSKGQSVVFGDSAPYILIKLEGMGAISTSIQSQKAPYQDGETYIDTVLEPRTPYAEIMVLAENETDMGYRRRRLAEVLNPKLGPGTLRYDNMNTKVEIEATIELGAVFPDAGDFKDKMQPAMINFYCPEPFLKQLADTINEMRAVIGGFEFPLEITYSFRFEESGENLIVKNTGDVPVPVLIEFNGPAVNPRVDNLTTGEFIRVNREIPDGGKLVISTEFGNKKVVLITDEGEVNVMHWLDLQSTFWRLIPGDNLLSYAADSGKEAAVVKIVHRNRFVGV